MRDLGLIIRDARRETNTWAGTQLARLLGCSVRTVYRNVGTGGLGGPHHHHALIRATHATNPALAHEYATAIGTSLDALGLATPALPPTATRPEHADAVVYAAADVLQLAPSAVRPAIAAAFARAHELQLSVAGLVPYLVKAKAGIRKP
ncbi:MAG: hypothetical protein ACYDCL_00700 [Myxococcales bacterium]